MVFLSSVYSLKLGHKLLPGMVAVGSYDGKTPKFTAVTQGERILLLSLTSSTVANARSGKNNEVRPDDITFLNINQPISCLCAGPIVKNSERSYLFVGTISSVLGYDVENNKDLFYKEVSDGVNVITTVSVWGDDPLVIAGGNCSLQGFDSEGNDCFWTVTGDNVGAIALLDFDRDGSLEMLVGSDDYDIRVFKGDQIIGETSETDAVTCIAPLMESIFAYALANGTIGVYDKLDRLWRIKSKNVAVAICAFDFDGDGIPELVTAWSNGKLDIRNIRNGEVVYKDNFKFPLAGLCIADVNQDGRLHLICCDVEGELRIYGAAGADGGRLQYISPNVEQEAVRELSMKKHHLMLELKNYEVGTLTKSTTVGDPSKLSSEKHRNIGAISNKTQLQATFAINLGSEERTPFIEITLTTNNDTVIRAALLFAEGIFQGECHVIHPPVGNLSPRITVPLSPPKNVVVDLHIKAYVGHRESSHFHVFELTRQLPRFAMYALCKEEQKMSECGSYVRMPISERPSRILMWLNQNFLLARELDYKSAFTVSFMSLRDSEEMVMEVGGTGEVKIHTHDMDLAGDLVQSISSFLNVTDLETEADFPEEVAQLEMLLRAVDEYQESNERLGADIADQSGVLKTLLIRAEDARMIGDTKAMRKWYTQLHEVNKGLIIQHQIRCTTNENVVESIKGINQIIQRAARLRVGRPKAEIITACRTAIKEQNTSALSRIIKFGVSK